MEYVVYSHGKYTKYIHPNNIYIIQSNKNKSYTLSIVIYSVTQYILRKYAKTHKIIHTTSDKTKKLHKITYKTKNIRVLRYFHRILNR
jgi:hypothetical protein